MRTLLVFAFAFVLAVPAFAADQAFPVAVIDLEEVFNTAKAFAARKENIQKQGQDAQTEMKKMEAQEKELRGKLSLLTPANPDHGVTLETLELLKARQKIYLDRTRATLERAQVDLLASATAEVRAALRRYSEENGWKMVLLSNSQELGRGNLQETQIQLGMQGLLYVDPAHDITISFIAWLNARDAAASAPAATPATPATPASGSGLGAGTATPAK